MRSAADFNEYYRSADPWGIEDAAFRDQVLLGVVARHVAGKRVLELGCGEGHLTATLFANAASVLGIDISDTAISRAKLRGIRNAWFEVADILAISFEGFDVITAIECVYYLSADERKAFFAKIKREHRGIFIMSNPIIGGKYFTHDELMAALREIGEVSWHNIYPRQTGPARLVDLAMRYGNLPALLNVLPEALVYQRAYVVQ